MHYNNKCNEEVFFKKDNIDLLIVRDVLHKLLPDGFCCAIMWRY